ncbi:MAG TPA: TadE/TadG family type IV pilus assembly protein [Devosia sp.]|nr:TadE/TadG family type IV pilus assembly protein [Devosia sp.]
MKRGLDNLPRRICRDQRGAAAVEFALLIIPLLFLLMGIMEVSMQYFVSGALDAAVQRTARLIRTGQAQSQNMTIGEIRGEMCSDILNLFDCSSNSYILVDTLDNLVAPTYTLPVKANGDFISTATYELGSGHSYVMVRGYFQFSPLFNVFGALSPGLSNGKRLLVASALFRNEPF